MRLRPAGERPPYAALLIGLLLLATYLVNISAPAVYAGAAEVLRDGPSPAAPWRRPSVDDLLAGRACIPMTALLENREPEPEHSFSRNIACDRQRRPS